MSNGKLTMKLNKWIGLCILLLICGVIFLSVGDQFLVVDEQPKESDVIIVLSGGLGRLEKGADLYKEGYAHYVLLTRANEEFITKEEAIDFGIPEQRLILEEAATSTYTNALYAKSLMEKYQFKSAIVVSSDYHMRRTKFIFDRVYNDKEMEFTYVASSHSGEVGDFSISVAFREYVKLVGYYLGMYKWIDLEA